MPDLSILIPARNEMWLAQTIQDIFAHARADTEVIAVLDGEWPNPPLPDHPHLRVTHSASVIGQRAATNLAARMSRATYVMKLDAHCSLDEGFDAKLIAADRELGRPDVTQIPAMYNLHAFNWKCQACGFETYQGPTPAACTQCQQAKGFERVVYWERRQKHPRGNGKDPRGPFTRTEFWRFDAALHFQYWRDYGKRPAAQGDLVDVMSSVGACFFMRRDRFWALDGLDERHGSWGQFGTEIACKSWLSGGRHIVNKRTWFAHLFRTQGGDFSFPYPMHTAAQEAARAHSRALWIDGTWPNATRPLAWLVEKFAPLPDAQDWRLPDAHRVVSGRQPDPVSPPVVCVDPPRTKGLVYYSDNRGDPSVLTTVREQLTRNLNGHRAVSVTLGPVAFGQNLVPRICKACGAFAWTSKRPRRCVTCGAADPFGTIERGYWAYFTQILAGLEALDTDVAFLCEHDVLYHPSHFVFTPPRDDTFYYNQHTWRVDAETGRALFYYCNQVSGLCAARALLLDHYRKRVAHVDQHGFDRSIGFEPSGNRTSRELFGEVPVETWMSEGPNVDIKTRFSLTPGRWSQEQFRNKATCQGWTEAEAVPGWGVTAGRFAEFLTDVRERRIP